MLEHERWLEIVKEDLAAAKLLLKGELFSSVTYHSQQAAEKALKAFIVFKNRHCDNSRRHCLQLRQVVAENHARSIY